MADPVYTVVALSRFAGMQLYKSCKSVTWSAAPKSSDGASACNGSQGMDDILRGSREGLLKELGGPLEKAGKASEGARGDTDKLRELGRRLRELG